MRDGVEHAERHDAAAGRRVGRDDEARERACAEQRRAQKRGAQVAGGADLQRHVAFDDDALEVRSGIAVGPPFTWNETCGLIASSDRR